MDSKMYHFICFILLMSLEGLKAVNDTTSTNFTVTQEPSTSDSTNTALISTSSCPKVCSTSTKPDQFTTQKNCLFSLIEEKLPWVIILFLLLICLILLLINMCLLWKCCHGTRNNYQVVQKSSITTRKSSVSGGHSETDIMLKNCSSVKVEIETSPDDQDDPEEMAGAASKTENQVSSGEESKNSAGDTSEAVPAQEDDQSVENELKIQ